MISTSLQSLLDRKMPTGYGVGVYVCTDNDGVCLYVGQSYGIPDRLDRHMGVIYPFDSSLFGRAILNNKPISLQWVITIYNLSDCKAYYPDELLALSICGLPHDSLIIDEAEKFLLQKLKPLLNKASTDYKKPESNKYTHARPNDSSSLYLIE